MASNVSAVIIPSQRKMVADMREGRAPDPEVGKQAALRSLHNNYFTLPVVFTMISGHYPMTFGHAWNWAILLGLAAVGAGIRHLINLHHKGLKNGWIVPGAAVGMVALALVSRPQGQNAAEGGSERQVEFDAVRVIVAQRCAPCHSSTPTNPGFPTAPQGVILDTPRQIQVQAGRISAVAVSAQTMPLGNLTGMTADERALLGRWIAAGARIP
jgi:uncharacterized membrane protein